MENTRYPQNAGEKGKEERDLNPRYGFWKSIYLVIKGHRVRNVEKMQKEMYDRWMRRVNSQDPLDQHVRKLADLVCEAKREKAGV